MFVRLALEDEEDVLVSLAREGLAETFPDDPVDENVIRHTFRAYISSAATTFFFVERDRKVLGFLQAAIYGYDYRAGFFTAQKVLYVSPEHRGTRAAALLMREFMRWSREIGAQEILGGNHNGFRSSQMASFLGRFGFENRGVVMAYRIEA